MSSRYGELQPTSGRDWYGSLRHPYEFQRLSRLGSVTARQSSSERQPNFAALNRGRRLCLVGRPSRWALAHILVCFFVCFFVCRSNISGTAERICAKYTGKRCLVPRSEAFEYQGQRSRSPGTKTRCTFRSPPPATEWNAHAAADVTHQQTVLFHRCRGVI